MLYTYDPFFITFNSYAQDHNADSLKRLLRTEIADTTRILILKNLAYHYWYSSPDTSLILSQQGLALASMPCPNRIECHNDELNSRHIKI